MLHTEKMKKMQRYSYISLQAQIEKIKKYMQHYNLLQIYEGQICLSMRHLIPLALQVNSGVILGMDNKVGVE